MRRILRMCQVIELTGLPRSSVYALIRQGKFPEAVPVAGRRVGWDSLAVQRWIAARLRGEAA